jgi:hypothetical protein
MIISSSGYLAAVIQYKQRDALAQDRPRTIRALAAGLKGGLTEVATRAGKAPRRYVLFTNLDLTHVTSGQKGQLRRKILEGWTNGRVPVQIVGASELASMLNAQPALRSAFFPPMRFETWEMAWERHKLQTLSGRHVPLIGRNEELGTLRSLIDDPAVRVIVLSGPNAMGKSRLALEACSDRPLEPVVALDAKTMSTSALVALESPQIETLVIMDDPEPERAEEFVRDALGREQIKLIVTLSTPGLAFSPNFGYDPRVRLLPVGALSDTRAGELLRATGAQLDYSLEAWIIDEAGGNPGVLLLAASLGSELRQSAAPFGEAVAAAFLRRIRTILGEDAARILRLLSLFTHVAVAGTAKAELEGACRLLGDGITPNLVLNVLPSLVQTGVVRQAGAYVEVVPPLLANSLAEAALRGRVVDVVALFGSLSQVGRVRLLRRLRGLKGSGAEDFWDQIIGPYGLFRDLASVVENGYLFQQIASAVPGRAGQLIEQGLKGLGLEARRKIKADARWQLVSTLEELLFRLETSAVALRCLMWLGEAETERNDNAGSEFCEAFYALHPQMPLPLEDRQEILRDILASPDRLEAKLLAIRAISEALRGTGVVSLRRGSGPGPLDTRPALTYGEIWDYTESLARLLFEVAESGNDGPARAAQAALPHALAACAEQARPKWAVSSLRRLTEHVARGELVVTVSDLADALRHAQAALRKRRAPRPEDRAELRELVEELNGLIDQIDRGNFATRFKRWLGGWGPGDHERVGEEHGQPVYRSSVEIQTLAQEAIDRPEELTQELLAWLGSRGAQKAGTFSWWLGKLDTKQRWRPRIEQYGREEDGTLVFSSYFTGLGVHSRTSASSRLDELVREPDVVGKAIVSATGGLGGDLAGVERVVGLLTGGRVDPAVTVNLLSCGGWITPLQSAEYVRLLQAIAGSRLEHAIAVINFLGMWLHTKRPIEGELAEFAWLCLESMPKVTGNDEYDCDQLAARVMKLDPDRGFRLFEQLMKQAGRRETWNPLGHYRERKFWTALLIVDRVRAVRLAFSVAASSSGVRGAVTWDLRDALDQAQDRDIVVAYALEGRDQAELVADVITSSRPGFWPIALRIVEAYAKDEPLLENLAHGIGDLDRMTPGPLSAHFERCSREVGAVRADPATPRAAHAWLERIQRALRLEAERRLLQEVEENVNDFRRMVESPAAPERRWAVEALLRHGKIDEALKISPKEELLRSVAKLELSVSAKREIRRRINRLT